MSAISRDSAMARIARRPGPWIAAPLVLAVLAT
jgi:hypothetical protein